MSEFRPSRFQILPLVVKNLIIINGLVYLAQITLPSLIGYNLEDLFALHYWGSKLFRPHQFVTHLFMHGSFWHLFFNMFALWMFGNILENIWGPKRFLIFYMVCGLGAALCHMGVLTYENIQLSDQYLRGEIPAQALIDFRDTATLGASGAVFGLLFAFGYLFPNSVILIYFFLPLKAKYFVALYAIFELFAGLQNSAGDNVAHFAHLGGMFFAFILLKIWNKGNRQHFY